MDHSSMAGPSRKRSSEQEAGPSRPLGRSSSLDRKRPRLTPEESPVLTDAALLYHTATAAHIASTQHLQQAFIPSWVETASDGTFDPVPLYPTKRLAPDPHAADTALALQLLALDLLSAGLKLPNLSDSERAAFTIEWLSIGIKVRQCAKGSISLAEDMHDAMASGVSREVSRLTIDGGMRA